MSLLSCHNKTWPVCLVSNSLLASLTRAGAEER